MPDPRLIQDDHQPWGSQRPRILIAGASVRAAVQSAQRSGWPWLIAADLFQDRDLGSAQRCPLADDYDNLPNEAVRLRADAWMYCGAIENRPDLVERVRVPLLGCGPSVLRAVRDPWQVAQALATAGLPTIDLARDATGLPRDGSWLRKRIASAAGRHIVPIDDATPPTSGEPVYFQRRVEGMPTSAVFVATKGTCRLLGTSRQLIGTRRPGDGGFQYLGSAGPEPLDGSRRAQWERIGEVLTQRFSLQGLFGVDAIVAHDRILPVEVNPRFTASVEVLERVDGWNAWSLHWQACREGNLPRRITSPASGIAAKRILFSAGDLWVSDSFLDWAEAQNAAHGLPSLADLPAKPGHFPRGAPVLTVLAGPTPGDNWGRLSSELSERLDHVQAALHRTAGRKPRRD